MPSFLKSKFLIEALIILVIGFFLYKFFLGTPAPVSDAAAAPTVGADLLKLSGDISAATLNRSLFSEPGYRSLTDFDLPLQPEPAGRSNPFDAIGRP
jgi:hypothetical protein